MNDSEKQLLQMNAIINELETQRSMLGTRCTHLAADFMVQAELHKLALAEKDKTISAKDAYIDRLYKRVADLPVDTLAQE